ncbi:MAG TPA: EF-hand domain-containing protein [Allosphingosinicella sp.]|nr:EF-hand domain-containing protein [Allosphingosinicella sp.]
MKSLIIFGVAALAATPVLAQGGGDRGRFAQPQTRAEVQAQVQSRFARADSNRDGFLTQDEVRARAEARRSQRQQLRGERREQRFEQLDANNDGVISRSEFEALRTVRGERRGQRLAHRGGRGGMAGFGGRAFATMDLDRDGRISLAEAQRAALQRFDRIDSNRDGTIGPEERQAAREAFRERMRDRRDD